MKKLPICVLLMLAILAVLAVPASAVTPEEFALDMLVEPNSAEKLLEEYGSYSIHYLYDDGAEGIIYADDELFYSELETDYILYAGGKECRESDGQFAVLLYTGGTEPNTQWMQGTAADFSEEKVLEVVADGDRLTIKTQPAELLYGEDIEDGHCEFLYVVDAQSLVVLSGKYTSYTADGEVCVTVEMTMEYGIERPAKAQELLERMNPQEDYRTVTVVLDPGTENESVYTAVACKGDSVRLYLAPEYTTLYTDAECTQPYEGGADTSKDLTLYSMKAE